VLGDEGRRSKLCQAARFALRNHVAVEEMKASAMEGGIVPIITPAGGAGGLPSSPSSVLSAQAVQASRFNRFQSLSYLSGKFSISNLKQMLRDVGFCIDNADVPIVFYHFDVNIDGYIDRDEFINVLALTGYELDLALEEMKFCLTGSKVTCFPPFILSIQYSPKISTIFSIYYLQNTIKDSENEEKNKIRINRTLCDVFAAFNDLNDGILSYEDMCELLSKLEIFLDEREVRRALRIMDGGDDRIEEKDFIGFISNASRIAMDKANRLNECAGALRAWIQRNSDTNES
jgi:Ca2+-binding EF-hand superfamily protein